jgi:uncharacterized protein YbdZ (MbtH family)
MKIQQADNLNGFRAHGVTFEREAGTQAVGNCPFCQKDGHFYANKETKLWDCKRCGERGNFEDFLRRMAEEYEGGIDAGRLERLAKDRGLPADAFRGLGIGWDGSKYTLPIWGATGRVSDIRFYRPGGKLLSTHTATSGLFNVRDLVLADRRSERVFICEGEWDAIAWRWLVGSLGHGGIVVGVPGASAFKQAWAPLFTGRQVVALYDNDPAGIAGAGLVRQRLTGSVEGIKYLHWPLEEKLPTGWDIRDHVKKYGMADGSPAKAYDYIQRNLRDVPPGSGTEEKAGTASVGKGDSGGVGEEQGEKLPPITTKELIGVYTKWLHMASTDSLKVLYGTILANRMGGDPIWLFLVAPPGGMKSELLMSLAKGPGTHALSSLTPHTLISGASWKEGQDPSLLPQLKDKMLIVKDFTTLLTLHYSVRDEIFGTLRDVYDGQTEKVFGNGIRRKYEARFGILAGVTPVIETFNIVHQGLGERFLKFRISGNWDSGSEEAKILRCLNNIGHEDSMRHELQQAGSRWLANLKPLGSIPEISDSMKMRLVHLAKFAARLRGVVERDKFSGSVMYKPSSEVGTRLAKQMAKLGQGIAMFLEKRTLDEEVYHLIRRVALDTVPDRVEDIVRAVWDMTQSDDELTCKTVDVCIKTRLPQATIFRCLQDMNLLRLVENSAEKGNSLWRLSKKLMTHIREAKLYGREGAYAVKKKGLSIRRD